MPKHRSTIQKEEQIRWLQEEAYPTGYVVVELTTYIELQDSNGKKDQMGWSHFPIYVKVDKSDLKDTQYWVQQEAVNIQELIQNSLRLKYHTEDVCNHVQ